MELMDDYNSTIQALRRENGRLKKENKRLTTNTKTEQISSGLVAVAWREETGYERPFWMFTVDESQTRPNIRKVEPLVRLSDAEAIIAQKDSEILEQCRLNGMGAEREAALLGKVAQQSAALKLAKSATEAVIRYQTLLESGKPHGLINSYGNAYESCVEALAAINEVLGE